MNEFKLRTVKEARLSPEAIAQGALPWPENAAERRVCGECGHLLEHHFWHPDWCMARELDESASGCTKCMCPNRDDFKEIIDEFEAEVLRART